MRPAREADFEAVANLRTVIVPVGMDGAAGFMGKKIIIDDPAEAKRRRLMAKVRVVIPEFALSCSLLRQGRCEEEFSAPRLPPTFFFSALPNRNISVAYDERSGPAGSIFTIFARAIFKS